jgi:hypothetical protein
VVECALSLSGGLDIAGLAAKLPVAILLAKIVDGSPDAMESDPAIGDLGVCGVLTVGGDKVEVAEVATEGEAIEEFEENGEKTEPSTRFAFSLEASFLSSIRNLEGFLGSFASGWGLRSNGTNPDGRRVICIECGRRCLGRQGGAGSRAVRALSLKKSVGL